MAARVEAFPGSERICARRRCGGADTTLISLNQFRAEYPHAHASSLPGVPPIEVDQCMLSFIVYIPIGPIPRKAA